MRHTEIDKPLLVQHLRELGVRRGGVLLVHTAYSRVGAVAGGPAVLIAALLEALGNEGSLMMPSMSSEDEEVFDPSRTSCLDMGIVAETFWKLRGVQRSDNPHSFAAIGPKAEFITAKHPVDPPHGLNSPVGRAYELNAQILLLGVGHDVNTTVHLAENMSDVPYRRQTHVTLLMEGKATRYDYQEVDHCCKRFELLDDWLESEQLQRRGRVGNAEARLANSQDIVRVAQKQLAKNKFVFLHARGTCTECDDAWQSLPVSTPDKI